MTKETVLKKAINKAFKNGWKGQYIDSEHAFDMLKDGNLYYQFIFSHSFAKAFWKNEPFHCGRCGEQIRTALIDNSIGEYWCYTCSFDWPLSHTIFNWEYYLREMVLEEKPLLYIVKFI